MTTVIKNVLLPLLCSLCVPAFAQTLSIGETDFPLGSDAFPNAASCLDPTGCGSSDNQLIDASDPLFPAVATERALVGQRLDLVTLDLDANDVIELDFPVPIVNQPGDDIYIAQALFINALDGLGDAQGINDIAVQVGDSGSFTTIPLMGFTPDMTMTGPVVVTYADPELKQDAYGVQDRTPQPPLAGLWYVTLDLSDFGYAADAGISRLALRGSTNLAGSGLDAIAVGNLNSAGTSVVNEPPVVQSPGAQASAEGDVVALQIVATDPNGNALTYSAVNLPPGLAIDAASGLISGTITFEAAGSYTVTATATDDGVPPESAQQSFDWTVANVNRAPQIVAIAARTVQAGSELLLNLSGSDPDGDALAFSIANPPVGAMLVDGGTGTAVFRWTPAPSQAGSYDLTFTVTDSGLPPASASMVVQVSVTLPPPEPPEPLPPVLAPIGDFALSTGESLSATVTATDADSATLIFSAAGLPPGAELTDGQNGTAALSWTPSANQVGDYAPTITVADDSGLSDSETFTISVSAPVNGGLQQIVDSEWNRAAVRNVLRVFAYGGAASDPQIDAWAAMTPDAAIRQILTFEPSNPLLSPAEDATVDYAGSLAELQALWTSPSPDNRYCLDDRSAFNETNVRADGNVVLRNLGLQNTWIGAVRSRGLNPFRHKVGFWLANYQMAVNLRDTEPPLVREHYDSALNALANQAPFYDVLAVGATSAAVAREYGHRSNIYNNVTGVFRGNDDFAREFHQLFFLINGDTEDPDYHENTTIENTAWALTGMQIDKVPNAYGTTLTRDWWVAPIDFSDHFDATGRNIRNVSRHYQGSLEILREAISGATAEEKVFSLAAIAGMHPESLANLPVAVVNFFADDNLDAGKIAEIRAEWSRLAGQPNDLLEFMRSYAVSTAFHRADTYKYRTAFDRNLTIYSLNTVDNEEHYGNSYTPRGVMRLQGAEVFIPVHDVFGGQTSLNAANNPNLFKEAYNSSVNFPNRIAKTAEACNDAAGNRIGTWRKEWARVMPAMPGGYRAEDVGDWLWRRFVGDGGRHYGVLEQAHVAALLATGMDLGFVLDSTAPDTVYSVTDLLNEPYASIVADHQAQPMALDSAVNAERREANRRVGMAVNFIAMTPFMFATEGGIADSQPADIAVPDVTGFPQPSATDLIVTSGLTVGAITQQASATVPAGFVISQAPAGGAMVPPGTTVDLVVSSGPASVAVPDVLGLTEAEATMIITDADLVVAGVTALNDPVAPVGTVTGQTPDPGVGVAPGSGVFLFVSAGPAANQAPAVTLNAPADGAVFSVDDTIAFAASATDAEDGDLSAGIVWTSDLDGVLGTGGAIAANLSLGTHTVSAAVTDSGGLADVDAIALIVELPAEADSLDCGEFVYKREKDRLRLQVGSSDRSGNRILTAFMDGDGDGIDERNLGVIPIRPGSTDQYRATFEPFPDPNPTTSSTVTVTSDLGGVCSRSVKID